MDGLNYHHLFYFWTVARSGSISRASGELGLTQPTISEQLGLLEKLLGKRLFDRVGRSLVLTDSGHIAFRHAEQIFSIGRELQEAISRNQSPARQRLQIVVDPAVDPALVGVLLRRVGKTKQRPELLVTRKPLATGISELADGKVDLAIGIAKPKGTSKLFSHPLVQCGISFLADSSAREKFPGSLRNQTIFVPDPSTRSELIRWMRKQSLTPRSVEICDPAMSRQLAVSGWGVAGIPDIGGNLGRGDPHLLGKTNAVQMRTYGFTRERRPLNPSLRLLLDGAPTRSR